MEVVLPMKFYMCDIEGPRDPKFKSYPVYIQIQITYLINTHSYNHQIFLCRKLRLCNFKYKKYVLNLNYNFHSKNLNYISLMITIIMRYHFVIKKRGAHYKC